MHRGRRHCEHEQDMEPNRSGQGDGEAPITAGEEPEKAMRRVHLSAIAHEKTMRQTTLENLTNFGIRCRFMSFGYRSGRPLRINGRPRRKDAPGRRQSTDSIEKTAGKADSCRCHSAVRSTKSTTGRAKSP
jgi:hypothetical protein